MLKNFDYCVYTYLHRKELEYKINKIVKNEEDKKALLERAKTHDMDKMTLYLLIDKKTASNYHRETASHHMENNLPKTRLDKLEAIMDYESAGLKPDKNLNAYDTVMLKKPDLKDELLPLIDELHIAYSYPNSDDKELLEYIKQFQPVTEEMILREVMDYLTSTPDNVYIKFKENNL